MLKKSTILRSTRLLTRISCEEKVLLQRAAELTGCSLSQFVVQSAYVAALRVIQDYEITRSA